MINYLRMYIKRCQICQLHRNEKPQPRQLKNRINANYKANSRLSMDVKVIPRSYKGHIFITVIINEVTNFILLGG